MIDWPWPATIAELRRWGEQGLARETKPHTFIDDVVADILETVRNHILTNLSGGNAPERTKVRYLTIYNSDGDTIVRIHDEFPHDDVEGMCVYGSDLIERTRDTNYWPERSIVLLKVDEG